MYIRPTPPFRLFSLSWYARSSNYCSVASFILHSCMNMFFLPPKIWLCPSTLVRRAGLLHLLIGLRSRGPQQFFLPLFFYSVMSVSNKQQQQQKSRFATYGNYNICSCFLVTRFSPRSAPASLKMHVFRSCAIPWFFAFCFDLRHRIFFLLFFFVAVNLLAGGEPGEHIVVFFF